MEVLVLKWINDWHKIKKKVAQEHIEKAKYYSYTIRQLKKRADAKKIEIT